MLGPRFCFLSIYMSFRAQDASVSVHFIDSCRAIIAALRIFALGFFFFALSAQALPRDLSGFDVLSGGLTDIQDGAYIEGSISKGGIQPDYRVDLESEPLKSLMETSRGVGQQKLKYWDKIGIIVELVNENFFRYNNYSNPYYRRLLKQYRDKNQDIPLSEYGVCSAGVCREHALVLHFALKAAGIENKHAYAQIYRASNYDGYEITEDHAFNVVEYRGVKWVVDSYYPGFNGYRLKDIMSKEGVTEYSPQAPIAISMWGTRRIIKINDFPKVYNPKSTMLRCEAVF